MLTILPINHFIFAIVVPYKPMEDQNNLYIACRIITDVVMILVLLLSYRVFMSLRRVELQMNPRFSQPEQILKALKRQMCIEKSIFTMLIIFIVMLTAYTVVLQFDHLTFGYGIPVIIYYTYNFIVYLANLVIIGYFANMSRYFLSILQVYEINKCRVQVMISTVMVATVLTLTRYLVYIPIWYMIYEED